MPKNVSSEVRRQVAERAGWRCEYCLLPEESSGYPHQIDHILSRKHGGDSTEDNLALACAVCNRYKGADVAASDRSGQPVSLFIPAGKPGPNISFGTGHGFVQRPRPPTQRSYSADE